jgi:hypothetical protein
MGEGDHSSELDNLFILLRNFENFNSKIYLTEILMDRATNQTTGAL